jgi:outer membrane protein assembly factor BamD
MLQKAALLFILVISLSVSSCSKYNRLLKSNDYELKYNKAIEYYEKQKYANALTLFEELITIYRGNEKGEKVMLYYAYCQYGLDDYILASYHFKNFVRTYPNSEHAEEAMYMNAYCYQLNSPESSLDQSNTISAIEEFQLFANMYPKSNRITECNANIDKLRLKLETKAFDNAKLYYNMGDYKSSIVAFENILKDYPDTRYRDEVSFMALKSNYLLAINSIEEKQLERLRGTVDVYYKFIDKFPKSQFINQAEQIYTACQKGISKKSEVKTN